MNSLDKWAQSIVDRLPTTYGIHGAIYLTVPFRKTNLLSALCMMWFDIDMELRRNKKLLEVPI